MKQRNKGGRKQTREVDPGSTFGRDRVPGRNAGSSPSSHQASSGGGRRRGSRRAWKDRRQDGVSGGMSEKQGAFRVRRNTEKKEEKNRRKLLSI